MTCKIVWVYHKYLVSKLTYKITMSIILIQHLCLSWIHSYIVRQMPTSLCSTRIKHFIQKVLLFKDFIFKPHNHGRCRPYLKKYLYKTSVWIHTFLFFCSNFEVVWRAWILGLSLSWTTARTCRLAYPTSRWLTRLVTTWAHRWGLFSGRCTRRTLCNI